MGLRFQRGIHRCNQIFENVLSQKLPCHLLQDRQFANLQKRAVTIQRLASSLLQLVPYEFK
jgi:hypothetical protein